MSHYWRVACLDCGSEAKNPNIHRGEEICAAVAELAGAVAGLRNLPGHVQLLIDGEWIDVSWFVEHDGHHLVARSEYGEVHSPQSSPATVD